MSQLLRLLTSRAAWAFALLPAFVAGCGGGLDPILGTPGVGPPADVSRPTVVFAAPAPDAVGVPTNAPVTATFSEAMAPATLNDTSVVVTNLSAGSAVTGSVSYSAVANTVTFTPTGGLLAADAQHRVTVTTAATDLAGNALAGNTATAPAAGDHTWVFTTAAATPPVALPDRSRPTVVFEAPAADAVGVPTNTLVTATFSEAMAPGTVSETSFLVTNTTAGTTVDGTVSYSASARTVTFAPAGGQFAANAQFEVNVTTAATDLAGNALAGNTAVLPGAGVHRWTFGTAAAGDLAPPTVTNVSPADASTGQCLTKTASATFSEPMDPATLDTTTLLVTDNGTPVPGVVTYDAASQVASFTPSNADGFAPGTSFVVTVASGSSGVKDLAGNALASDRVWGFSTGTQACVTGVDLGSAASFGAFGGSAGVTNQGIDTVVGGNLGTTAACTLVTGFHDATDVYTETTLNVGVVNGGIHCAPPAPGTATSMAIATQAQADAQTAYNELAALPPGSDPGAGELGGLVLPPGVYTSAGGTFSITTGDLTLDAQGDPNAVWVFQSAAALTVGLPATPRRVLLINGAQAGNVYWQVGSAARIEDGSSMVGTIIAPAGVTISTAGQTIQTTLVGRAIGLSASVTLVNTTIVAP